MREFLVRDEAHVPMPKRRAAIAARVYAEEDLGLPVIGIRWYELPPMSPLGEAVGGWCPGIPEPSEIWIRCGCAHLELQTRPDGWRPFFRATTPEDIAGNVLHEMRHVRDNMDWGGVDNYPERHAETEANAQAYASPERVAYVMREILGD